MNIYETTAILVIAAVAFFAIISAKEGKVEYRETEIGRLA